LDSESHQLHREAKTTVKTQKCKSVFGTQHIATLILAEYLANGVRFLSVLQKVSVEDIASFITF